MKTTFPAIVGAAGTVGLALLVCGGRVAVGQTNVDMGAAGTAVNRDILGTNYFTQRPWAPVADRTMITGPAGGLAADMYDWQTQIPFSSWNSLGVLRDIRDSGSRPMFMVNMRGTGTADDGIGTNFQYTNTSQTMLATLAAQWVRYTNFILPNGGPLNAGDQAILDKITWPTAKLTPINEAPVPTVKYWEIGNEPDAYLYGIQFGTPAYPASDYVNRYKTITAAMKAVDPTIKLGPAISAMTSPVGPNNWKPAVADALLQSSATIDFWGYHSYDNLDNDFKPNGTPSEISTMESRLRGVRPYQANLLNLQKGFFTAAGRDPNNVEFRATEYNPMGTGTNAQSAPTMYQALALAETMFTYADLKLASANYWGLLAPDPPGPYDLWPMVKVWQKMNQNIGDTLVNSIIDDVNNRRVYITRDSVTGKVVVWGLNFDNDTDTSINLSLQNLAASSNATLSILNDGSSTTLWTGDEAKWTTQSLGNFNADHFNLNIPHAGIVMLEVMPVPEPAVLGAIGVGLIGLMVRRRRD